MHSLDCDPLVWCHSHHRVNHVFTSCSVRNQEVGCGKRLQCFYKYSQSSMKVSMLQNVTLTEHSCSDSGVDAGCLPSILQVASSNTIVAAITRRAIKTEKVWKPREQAQRGSWPENSGHGPGFTVYDSVYSTPYI